ncbi:MAG: ATP-binding protein, partial [Thermodesulfovibrionales bacterium]|nr:ATP-binding protein [Thermodesulfovibrionales bacterium]
ELYPVYNSDKNVYIITKSLNDWQNKPLTFLYAHIPADFLAETFSSFNFTLVSFITLSVFLLIILSVYISKWVIKPLILLNESLKTENTESLEKLKKQEDEFSDLSVMIEKFFAQRLRLMEEVLAHEEAKKSLLETQMRFESLFEFLPDAICLTTADGKIVNCNNAASQILQYSKDELLNMNFLDLLVSENPAHIFDITNLKLDSDVYFDEHECKRKNGAIFPVELGAKRILINNEDFIIFILREISEKKRLQMEKELLQKRQIESLGILAGGIAHDFNNMLTGIIGNIELAKFFSKNDPKITQKLDIAEQVAMKAKDLTQQLLTFSKGGAPVKVTASIKDILRESVSFLLSGKNIKCNFYLPDDLWFVEADIGQLNQVINNLIINAIEAMPNGGTIEISANNINVSSSQNIPLNEGEYVRIYIKDSGKGIAKENIDRIFEPYFTTKEEGTGLGLAVVYSIIKRHRGYIDVESKIGEGTTFTFYLPATQTKPEQKLITKNNNENKTGKVLIVDDDVVIREILKGFLDHLGYQTVCAQEGQEAIDLYKEAMMSEMPFDLVIMDLTIPGGMGGKEAINELLKIDPKVRAIVTSGYSNDSVMAEYKEYGFKAALTKPFKIDSLKEAISIAMN